MKKKIFFKNNKNIFYIFLLSFFLLIIFIYSFLLFISINQEYIVVKNLDSINYYIIPKDKEGEKVKYIDKKSINNISILDNKFTHTKDLKYTIQLLSDVDYEKIEMQLKKLLLQKSEIILPEDLFIFSIISEIGTDYFLTYKNFNSKDEAMFFCEKLSFVKKCLIINPQN